MQVRLRRTAGAHRQAYGGTYCDRRPASDPTAPVENGASPLLQLLGADRAQWPNLYEPRLIACARTQMPFLGFERFEDRAWVLHQLDCELL